MAKRGENIYKRKDGRYEGRYIRGRHVSGKPLFGYVYGYTYQDVKMALTFAKADTGRDRQVRFIGKGTLAEYLSYWLEHAVKSRVKPSTYAQYHERVYKHIIPALGALSVRAITREQVQMFVEGLEKKGLAPSTISNIARLLHSAMCKAKELYLSAINPCEGMILPAGEAKERCVLSRQEQVALERLAAFADREIKLGVFLSLYAGLRIGEICALRWRDVDLFSGTLTVRSTLQRVTKYDGSAKKTMLLEGSPKSRRSFRRVPLPAGLSERLLKHGRGICGDHYVLSGEMHPVEPRTLRARFTRLAARAGLSIPFHALRHTYATRCLEHNFDIQTLSELLGHSNASVTMKVYAHSVFEHKRLLTDRIKILSEYPAGQAAAGFR